MNKLPIRKTYVIDTFSMLSILFVFVQIEDSSDFLIRLQRMLTF